MKTRGSMRACGLHWKTASMLVADFIGQERVKENIEIAVHAARKRGEALDHVLLYGPPGLGKTSLAQIIANEPRCEY